MVCLYTCGACLKGDHVNCERGHPAPKGVFGGSSCICHCRGRSEEQMKADDEKWFEEQMKKIDEFENISKKDRQEKR